mgnify:CR=1 FL=1
MLYSFVAIVLLFQAEDGIRDLVRSRGLGDVYKRQHTDRAERGNDAANAGDDLVHDERDAHVAGDDLVAVSYTHLTLPTSDLV